MGGFHNEIPDTLIPWIEQQRVFWVATAPLSPDGHVNVSPKGVEGTFHVADPHTVWYEDLSGSGEHVHYFTFLDIDINARDRNYFSYPRERTNHNPLQWS